MEEKIVEDKIIIDHLSEEIAKYKGWLEDVRAETRPSFRLRASRQDK